MGGFVSGVDRDSVGARLGVKPGDVLLAINSHPVRDVIDVQFYAADDFLTLRLRRQGQEMTLRGRRRYEEPLGLQFAQPTFDQGIRRCNNHCEFCFVSQMPPGLRPSLYVRDDDYRYSFLFGNYITLTNLSQEDWRRIEQQHLSPLYVSVHATDPHLRRRMLGNPHAPDVVAQLHRLTRTGIEVHTQLVLLPGVNDGPHLDRSLRDLADLYPAVRSVSVVPVGLTRYHRGKCRPYTPHEMEAVFIQVTTWQRECLARLGVRFVHLSDEWYLRQGQEVPSASEYDGLDLTENGVGLVRRFLDGWEQAKGQGGMLPAPSEVTLVTGKLFAPVLRRVAAEWAAASGSAIEVVSVANRFFGPTVTVAGLLTGQDVITQLQATPARGEVVLPAAMFGGPRGQSLDEMRPQEVEEALGRPVIIGEQLAPPGAT